MDSMEEFLAEWADHPFKPYIDEVLNMGGATSGLKKDSPSALEQAKQRCLEIISDRCGDIEAGSREAVESQFKKALGFEDEKKRQIASGAHTLLNADPEKMHALEWMFLGYLAGLSQAKAPGKRTPKLTDELTAFAEKHLNEASAYEGREWDTASKLAELMRNDPLISADGKKWVDAHQATLKKELKRRCGIDIGKYERAAKTMHGDS